MIRVLIRVVHPKEQRGDSENPGLIEDVNLTILDEVAAGYPKCILIEFITCSRLYRAPGRPIAL